MSATIRTRLVAAIAVGLALAAVPGVALASTTHQRWSTANGQRFAAAVVQCEDRATTAPALRSCVDDLIPPNPAQAEIMDLWRIFMDCLWLRPSNMKDQMYPPDYYEDLVNDCLGL
jgi:hypothetical protein